MHSLPTVCAHAVTSWSEVPYTIQHLLILKILSEVIFQSVLMVCVCVRVFVCVIVAEQLYQCATALDSSRRQLDTIVCLFLSWCFKPSQPLGVTRYKKDEAMKIIINK